MARRTHAVAVVHRDLADLLFWSFRYALGRMTYAPGAVADLIRRYAAALEAGDVAAMVAAIDEADRVGDLGMDCDVRTWRELRAWLVARSEAAALDAARAPGRSTDHG